MVEKEEITVAEAGRRGGCTTRDRHAATGFYQRIGRKGGERTKELYGDLFSEFGKRGGRPRRPSLAEQRGEGHLKRKESRSAPRCSPPS